MSSLANQVSTWTIYQPLIVGLGAVVLATVGNTLLEWFKQSISDKSLANSLRKALIEELRMASETASVNFTRTSKVEQGGSFIIPIQERYHFYEANISNIGKLRSDQISAVVKAYGILYSKIETLSVIGSIHRIENCVLQAVVDGKWGDILAEQNSGMVADLNEAIRVLER